MKNMNIFHPLPRVDLGQLGIQIELSYASFTVIPHSEYHGVVKSNLGSNIATTLNRRLLVVLVAFSKIH